MSVVLCQARMKQVDSTVSGWVLHQVLIVKNIVQRWTHLAPTMTLITDSLALISAFCMLNPPIERTSCHLYSCTLCACRVCFVVVMLLTRLCTSFSLQLWQLCSAVEKHTPVNSLSLYYFQLEAAWISTAWKNTWPHLTCKKEAEAVVAAGGCWQLRAQNVNTESHQRINGATFCWTGESIWRAAFPLITIACAHLVLPSLNSYFLLIGWILHLRRFYSWAVCVCDARFESTKLSK